MTDFTSAAGSDTGGQAVPHTVYTELQRGESLVEKQVKEARTKCRSIASLLTDAPNPNSKGVLMFKKRRQRAKKYTLTCFGKAEGDQGGETEGETGGETEEEGGSSILSGSEVDEEGFSASFDPTWDTGYLDLLDRRSSACPSTTPTTPTTPTANQNPGLDTSAYQGLVAAANHSQGLEVSELEKSPYQGSVTKKPITDQSFTMSPPAVALTNGGSVAVSRASVVLSPPTQTPLASQNGQHGASHPDSSSDPHAHPMTDAHNSLTPNTASMNRTARPFTPGPTASRPSVTSVMFRPPQPKPTTIAMATKPMAAVSMVTISPTQQPHGPDARRAVSSTSLYIPPRNNNSNTPPSLHSPPSALSPPSSLSSAPLSQPPANSFSPKPTAHTSPSTMSPPSATPPKNLPPPTYLPPPISLQAPPISSPHPPDFNQIPFPSHPNPPSAASQFSPLSSVHPHSTTTGALTPGANTSVATAPLSQASDAMVTREQRIAVPAARTGILNDARRRSNKKPMFSAIRKKDVSVNPDLLSMVHNLDDRFVKTADAESAAVPAADAGHESGPEEDWLRLGAEACNFMQAQRGPRPPPVAPKPQSPQVPQLGGKGGQLFARRQHRMDRYVVDRSPSVAAAPYSPAQTREPSPTPSLPAAWKYSSNIRAPPPISYNPLLSPSCPPKAQKKPEMKKSGTAGPKGKKSSLKPVDIMSHQPYQLNSSLFSYGGGVPQDGTSTSQQQKGMAEGPQKTARVYEVKRFSTPPPTSTGPALKVIVPRSATTLGEPLWRPEAASPPPATNATPQPYHPPVQPFQPQCCTPLPPAPTAPLPQLPTFSSSSSNQVHSAAFSQPVNAEAANRQFKSAPALSPLSPPPSSTHPSRVPRPRFSTSNLGLQPCVWRPGSTMH